MTVSLRAGERFPTYGGVKVSVLIPTRGRPVKLARALSSLHTKAARPNQVEYLIWVDSDDGETLEFLDGWDGLPPNTLVVVGDRGRGYLDLHLYLNTLAALSHGDWLMNFNDDAEMGTEGWDLVFGDLLLIVEYGVRMWGIQDGVFLLLHSVEGKPDSWEFFAVHRTVFLILGHLSRYTGVDEWLEAVFRAVHRWGRTIVVIRHDVDEDQTMSEGRRVVDRRILSLVLSHDLIRGKLEDSLKLIDYIKGWDEQREVQTVQQG